MRRDERVIASDVAGLPWPLATLDIEASPLDQDSYPLEVGLAMWRGLNRPILGWSVLVAPTEDWLRRGHRSRKATALYGITDDDLRAGGRPVVQVAAMLDTLLGDATVAWCNGGDYDRYWLDRLYAAMGRPRPFMLGDWHVLLGSLDGEARDRVSTRLAQSFARHRARADAEALLTALAHGLGIDTGPAGEFASHLTSGELS